MDRANETDTLKAYLEGARRGEFWIGSTSPGRARIDYAIPLVRILELAIKASLPKPIP